MLRPPGEEDRPFLSVVMPVYNAEPWVGEAIASILAQTHSRFEFIILDDGSTDGSAAVVRDFAARDERIRFIPLPHRGQAEALNVGVDLARGRFVAHMDDDDVALPERFAVQLAWMNETGVDVCGGILSRFGDRQDILWFPERHEAIRHELLFRIGLHHGTSMVRADVAKAFPFNGKALHTDYEMLTRLALRHRLGNVPRVLLRHRCHALQAHVVHRSAFRDDINAFRRPYFHALFPEATAEDYTSLARIAERQACSDVAELARGGLWLARLARTPDAVLRRRMAHRWRTACWRSARLGGEVYRLYRRVAPELGPTPAAEAWALKVACALRLEPDARRDAFLRRVRRAARSVFQAS